MTQSVMDNPEDSDKMQNSNENPQNDVPVPKERPASGDRQPDEKIPSEGGDNSPAELNNAEQVPGERGDNQENDKPTDDKKDRPTIQLKKSDRVTAILPPKNPLQDDLIEFPPSPAYINKQRELILVIRGMVERFRVPEEASLTLGRGDPVSRHNPDIDLNPYGALDRGVSRMHAKLHVEDNQLFVTDLESTNGTFLSGKRIESNKPYLINKGDALMLGRLGIQILFRQ